MKLPSPLTDNVIINTVQAVTCSLSMIGFGESISSLIHQDSVWISRGIAVGILLLLLGSYTSVITSASNRSVPVVTLLHSSEVFSDAVKTCASLTLHWLCTQKVYTLKYHFLSVL